MVELVDLLGDVGDGAVVALFSSELEILDGVAEVAFDLVDQRDLAFDNRAFAQYRLGLRLVVPETRLEGFFGQLFEALFQLGDFKDAPLAPRNAF